jgi:hypothetical protein
MLIPWQSLTRTHKGSNSEKLQDLRQRQVLRQRELRVTERQLRLKARPKAGTA